MALDQLLEDVRACEICLKALPHGVRPVLQASARSRILIAGQAPGRKVHDSGVPFDDASGDRLRDWLGIDREAFYDADAVAILPMGFCFPGTGKAGDLPPRMECAETWRRQILENLPDISLTVILGRYALDWHLPEAIGETVTKIVQNWQHWWPDRIVLPHPSPRNNIWLKKNPWFGDEILPHLRSRVQDVLTPH